MSRLHPSTGLRFRFPVGLNPELGSAAELKEETKDGIESLLSSVVRRYWLASFRIEPFIYFYYPR